MIDKKFNEFICNRVKELRISSGLTSEQLAYQSGISKGGLSEIERNLKEPRLFTILKICITLNITLAEFFQTEELNNLINYEW